MRFRVGLGYDVHPFADAGPLVLGGVHIDDAARLAGHSDGDAVAHAVSDAVLGAAGLPDLGTLYPAADDQWRGCVRDAAHGYLLGCRQPARVAENLDDAVVIGVMNDAPRRVVPEVLGSRGQGRKRIGGRQP